MMRLTRLAAACVVPLTLVACSAQESAVEPAPAPSEGAPVTPMTSPGPTVKTASPTAAPTETAPGTTDPVKLDKALLIDGDLPGWQPAEADDSHPETTTDPAACGDLQRATVGKVASDMGAAAGHAKDDQDFTQFLDVVDNGKHAVTDVEKWVDSCQTFTMDDAGEKTPATVSTFPATGIGDESVGVRLTLKGDAEVDVLVVLAGHRDVLQTIVLQGEKPDPAVAAQLAKQGMEKLKKSI